jgi:hypothetical protein
VNKLFQNIRYDSRAGFGRNFAYYVGWVVLSFFMVCFVVATFRELSPDDFPGFFDVVSGFLLGVEKNDIFERTETVEIPFEWLMLHLSILFGIARYPRQDFEECGYHVQIRIRSKMAWWLSKVVWCFAHIVVMYAVWLLVIAVVEICFGGGLNFAITNVYHLKFPAQGEGSIYVAAFLMPVLCDFAIGMMMLAISFLFSSVIGLLSGLVVLLTSIFFYSRLLLGRYMMLYSYFSERADSSFHIHEGIGLCFVVIFSDFVIGYVAYAGKEK